MLRIYDNVIFYATERGKSIYELEKKAGLGNGTIKKWNESSPTIANLETVAGLLEVSVADLIYTRTRTKKEEHNDKEGTAKEAGRS